MIAGRSTGEVRLGGNEMKFERPSRAGSDQVRRSNWKSGGEPRNGRAVHPRREVLESPRATKPSSAGGEPVQRGRQSRGSNGESNDELMVKAGELEKLFAEMQIQAPADRVDCSGSSRTVSFSDDSRGRFYEKYMEKRELKLREEWRTRRPEKEMKLRALLDCFDQISAELRAKLLRPAEGYKPISGARSQAEKLGSFNMRSSAFCIQQGQGFDSTRSVGGGEAHELSGQKSHRNDGFVDQDLLSSAPQSPTVTVSQPSLGKASDLQQEKMKPGAGETRARSQGVSFAQSKGKKEEPLLVKEQKPGRRSRATRIISTSSSHSRKAQV